MQRERKWQGKWTLCIDIDGVLNRHREHFCALLQKYRGKNLKPEDITAIPVRNLTKHGITYEDEQAVLNKPEYWTNMPADSDAVPIIRELCEDMGPDLMMLKSDFAKRSQPTLYYMIPRGIQSYELSVGS